MSACFSFGIDTTPLRIYFIGYYKGVLMMKYIYLTLAFLCLICGSVGIVIPGLPTTPLLLAASFFFAKGS